MQKRKVMDFKRRITQLARAAEFKVSDIDDESAQMIFTMESGRDQNVILLDCDEYLSFWVPSSLSYESEDDIPGELLKFLRKVNKQIEIGDWSVEEVGETHDVVIIQNVPYNDLTDEVFETVILALIYECDSFEDALNDSEAEESNQAVVPVTQCVDRTPQRRGSGIDWGDLIGRGLETLNRIMGDPCPNCGQKSWISQKNKKVSIWDSLIGQRRVRCGNCGESFAVDE